MINLTIVHIWFVKRIDIKLIFRLNSWTTQYILFCFFEFENAILISLLINHHRSSIIHCIYHLNRLILMNKRVIHCFIQKPLWSVLVLSHWTLWICLQTIIHNLWTLFDWWLALSIKEFLSHLRVWTFKVFILVWVDVNIMVGWQLWYHRNGYNFIITWR